MNSPTFQLFKRSPTFCGGISAVVNYGTDASENYNLSKTGAEADQKAMYADWRAIGCDLNKVMMEYVQEKE